MSDRPLKSLAEKRIVPFSAAAPGQHLRIKCGTEGVKSAELVYAKLLSKTNTAPKKI